MDVRIDYYAETDMDAVRDLIAPIQREEFGVDISYEDQPDLTQVPTFYQRDGGQFWLALDGEYLVGTIALVDIGEHMGALRKMFVRDSHSGKEAGVAQMLLETLLSHAGGTVCGKSISARRPRSSPPTGFTKKRLRSCATG